MNIDEIFDNMDTGATVTRFNNDKWAGFDIAWSCKGWGFGHLTFGYDKEKDDFFADTECSGEDGVQKQIHIGAEGFAKLLIEIEKIDKK